MLLSEEKFHQLSQSHPCRQHCLCSAYFQLKFVLFCPLNSFHNGIHKNRIFKNSLNFSLALRLTCSLKRTILRCDARAYYIVRYQPPIERVASSRSMQTVCCCITSRNRKNTQGCRLGFPKRLHCYCICFGCHS